jgi:hypothetical protein
MSKNQDFEAAETVQTTSDQAVDPAAICSPAVERIVKAWTDAGRAPAYHRACQQSLRDQWPTLAWAIEALVKENNLLSRRPR